MGDIITLDTESYIKSLLPKDEGPLEQLRKISEEKNIPIISPEVKNYLELIIKTHHIKSILEIGTAVGYSAAVFAKAMGEDGYVTTIDRSEDMVRQATENIKKLGFQKNTTIIEGDAEETVKKLNGTYDLIFLDGGKGHYIHLLEDCLRLLKSGGLLISDNVLYKGMIASNALVLRRKITIVKRMRRYLEAISNDSRLMTSILPLGDGLAISAKK